MTFTVSTPTPAPASTGTRHQRPALDEPIARATSAPIGQRAPTRGHAHQDASALDFERALQARQSTDDAATTTQPVDETSPPAGQERLSGTGLISRVLRREDDADDSADPGAWGFVSAPRWMPVLHVAEQAREVSARAELPGSATSVAQARALDPTGVPVAALADGASDASRWQVSLPDVDGGLRMDALRTTASTSTGHATPTWSLQLSGHAAAALAVQGQQLLHRLRERAMDVTALRFRSHERIDASQQDDRGEQRRG